MNKRGFIFTFISVTLVSVILLAFLIQYTSRTTGDIESTNIKIETLNSFIKSLNNDYLPRAITVSTNQAVLSLLDCMDPEKDCEGMEEEYIPDDKIEVYLINALVNGRFDNDYGNPPNGPLLPLMTVEDVSYNLSSVLNEIVNLAEITNVKFNFEDIKRNQDIEIEQSDPWNIGVSLTITYTVSNEDESIKWNYVNKEILVNVSIINFRDPIYLVSGGVNITLNQSVYNLPGQVEGHAEDNVFINCNQAPNFLTRMMGETDAHEFGIESLVDIKSPVQSAIGYQSLGLDDAEGLSQIESSGYYVDSDHFGCYEEELQGDQVDN